MLLVTACGGGDGSSGTSPVVVMPAPTQTSNPTPTPSPTPTPTPTPEPVPTPTPTPTPDPTPTPLPSPTPIIGDGNWSTLQGDAGHTGYVAASFSTASFRDAWTITTSKPPSEVAARVGSVFYNVAQSDGHIFTRAISTSSGSSLWAFDLGDGGFSGSKVPYGPAYANNRVTSMIYNSTSTAAPMQVINATTGGYISTPTYDAQFSDGSVPTLVGDELYFASGYYGNAVFKANAATGNRIWSGTVTSQYGGYVMQGESVAVDQNYVYYFQAGSLLVLNRDGSVAKFIQNPFFSKNGLSYFGEYVGAPMLDANGHIFTFSDNRSSGQALPLVAFSLVSDKPLWRTGYSYTGHPAVRGDRLYAVRSSSTIVDLIDVSTGLLAGSVDVGGTDNLTSNVVVSDSHLFVSNAATTFAIEIGNGNFPVVWKTNFGGSLAVTPDNYLIISAATGLHAVKLK